MFALLQRPFVRCALALFPVVLAMASVSSRGAGATDGAAFALIGTASFPGGGFAVFDGNRPEYQGAVHPGGTLGEWTLAEIAHDHVRLKSAGREIELPIDHQLRRTSTGWETADLREPFHPREAAPIVTAAPMPARAPEGTVSRRESAPPEAAPPDKALQKLDKKLLESLKPEKDKGPLDFKDGDKSMKRIAKELRRGQ